MFSSPFNLVVLLELMSGCVLTLRNTGVKLLIIVISSGAYLVVSRLYFTYYFAI